MEIGTEVFVKGKGRGILALNNEDGTWCLDGKSHILSRYYITSLVGTVSTV